MKIHQVSSLVSCLLLVFLCVFRFLVNRTTLFLNAVLFDIWIYVAFFQLLIVAYILLRLPQNKFRHTALALVPAIVLLGGVYLIYVGVFDWVVIWMLELAVCVTIMSVWCLVIVGGLCLSAGRAACFENRRLVLRIWFAGVMFLVTAELGAWVVEHRFGDYPLKELSLPDHYIEGSRNTFHIASIGASTMQGSPYHSKLSIPNILHELLKNTDQSVMISNLAEGGINMRRAAEKLRELKVRPDLLLIYTGHNEFFYNIPDLQSELRLPRRVVDPVLEWSSFYKLMTSLIPQYERSKELGPLHKSILRDSPYTDEIVKKRIKTFEFHFRQLVSHCARHDISVLCFLPATNEGVFAPNRSICRYRLNEQTELALNLRYSDAIQLVESGKFQEAQKELQSIDATFPEIAIVEFWLGICCRELDQFQLAREYFRKAATHDRYPSHITRDYCDVVRRVTEDASIELIDASEILRQLSPSGMLDRTVIQDCVHPTLQGYYALGLSAFYSQTVRSLLPIPQDASELSYEDIINRLNITANDLAKAYLRTAYCLDFFSRFQVDPTVRSKEVLQFQRWAMQLSEGAIQPGESGTEGLTNDSPPGMRLPQALVVPREQQAK